MTGALPVWAVVKGTYAAVFRDFSGFVASIWIWLVLTWAASLGIGYLSLVLPSAVRQLHLAQLIIVPMYAGMAVVWHRYVQLHEEKRGIRTLRFGYRELKLFAIASMLLIGLLGPIVLGGGIVQTGRGAKLALRLVALYSLVLSFAFFYVTLRLSLTFPLTATDESHVFDKSWGMLKGKLLRLFAVLLVTYYPTLFLVGKLSEVGLLAIARKSYLLVFFIHALIMVASALGVCLAATAFSLALMHLRGIPAMPARR